LNFEGFPTTEIIDRLHTSPKDTTLLSTCSVGVALQASADIIV